MKRGKNPTRKQKLLIAAAGLQPLNWLVCKDTPELMELEHKYSTKRRTIRKAVQNV